jgi:hypothetical protein
MHNLEELLAEISGRGGQEKTAAPVGPEADLDLVERLRKYAATEAPAPSEDAATREGARRELAEKAAGVGVVRQVLAEISEVLHPGVKLAGADRDAVRVTAALDRGHHPRDIALELHKRAASGIGGALKGVARAVGEGSHKLLTGTPKKWAKLTKDERSRAKLLPMAGVATGAIGAGLGRATAPRSDQ